MVQFLKDPVFNTSLIVGYYWIPLTILIILYSFIFHAAWTLSKKSADKVRILGGHGSMAVISFGFNSININPNTSISGI